MKNFICKFSQSLAFWQQLLAVTKKVTEETSVNLLKNSLPVEETNRSKLKKLTDSAAVVLKRLLKKLR